MEIHYEEIRAVIRVLISESTSGFDSVSDYSKNMYDFGSDRKKAKRLLLFFEISTFNVSPPKPVKPFPRGPKPIPVPAPMPAAAD